MNENKPSTLLAAVGLGALSACVVSLALYAAGYMPQGWAGLGAFLGFFGAGFGLVPWWEWAHYKPAAQVYADEPATAAAPLPVILHTPINGIGAGTMHRYRATTQNEADWIDAEGDFLLWVRKLGTLKSTAHVGVSVKTPNDWMDLTGPLVDHGAILPKQSGVETRFAPDHDGTRTLNAVLNGWVQFPDRPAPRVTPFPAGRQMVDADVPDKAKAAEAV